MGQNETNQEDVPVFPLGNQTITKKVAAVEIRRQAYVTVLVCVLAIFGVFIVLIASVFGSLFGSIGAALAIIAYSYFLVKTSIRVKQLNLDYDLIKK